jgi:hypothetical protein
MPPCSPTRPTNGTSGIASRRSTAGGKVKNCGCNISPKEAALIPNPILKVLSTFRNCEVRALLMGGQACVFYGAAEFSRDTVFPCAWDTRSYNYRPTYARLSSNVRCSDLCFS